MEYSKTLIIASLSLLALAGASLAVVDPYQFGEYTANGTSVLRIQAIQLEYNLRIYAPLEAGTFKVVYFFSGFDCKYILFDFPS